MSQAQILAASAAVKQWAAYPVMTGRVRLSSPQTFRLLVETAAGHLLIATITLREPPDLTLVETLATIVDDRRFADEPSLRIQGEFEARYGCSIELIDADLDRDDPVALTGIVARSLVDYVRLIQPESPLCPMIQRQDIEASCRSEWASLRNQFISRLDAEAVQQARLSGELTPTAYTYVMTFGAEKRRNRAQALQVFPLLRPYLKAPAYRDIRETIDRGSPLIDALAEYWQVPKARVKALRGIEGKDLGLMAGSLPLVLRLLGDIPADWWPRAPETWQRFTRAVQVIEQVSKRPIATAANLLWLRNCARHGFEIDDQAPEEYVRMGEEIEEFMDMLRQALAHVQADAMRRNPQETRAAHFKLSTAMRVGMGLERLARTARRFGDNYRRAVDAFAQEAELWNGVRWPVIGTTEPRDYSGVLVHALQTPDDLRSEGQRMRNCVAGYVENCLRGRSQIWSFRLKDGTPLSTLETRTRTSKSGQHSIEVIQHKGVANEAPSPAAKRALQEFMLDLHSDKQALSDYRKRPAAPPRNCQEILL